MGLKAPPTPAWRKNVIGWLLAKEAVQYQEQPKEDQECDKCIQFVPAKDPNAPGSCKIVQGSINPKGWCIAFSPRKDKPN